MRAGGTGDGAALVPTARIPFIVSMSNLPFPSAQATADTLRSIERSRLRALVARNFELAAPLHATDFQLVTPVGMVLSRSHYLGAVDAGHLVYVAWDPQDIEVRVHGEMAALRYRSTMQVTFGAHQVPKADYWHTDLYEQRDGAWQVVWSQATGVQSAP